MINFPTGLKDRRGVDVSEGDWVLADISNYGSHTVLFVKYVVDKAAWGLFSDNGQFRAFLYEATDLEVFGNLAESKTAREAIKNYKG